MVLNKLLKEYPSDEEVLYKYALVCLASGDLNTAYENAEILINKNPDNKRLSTSIWTDFNLVK